MLMLANVAVYVAFVVTFIVCRESAESFFGLEWPLHKPWTVVSYMFTQSSALNLLFNLLWLWCLSRLFLEVSTRRRLLVAYLVGGLGGALFFVIGAAAGLCHGTLFGSSAAVLGIISSAATLAPRMSFRLMFFGAVEMRWIAIVAVTLSLLTFASGNVGGALAHAGGSLAGLALGYRWRFHRFSRRSFIIPDKEADTLNSLLDKVKRSGYDSLTPSERKQLDEISKKL